MRSGRYRNLLYLEQQLIIEKINLERKLEREIQDLRGSTNCLRLRERERLLLLSLFHRVTIVDYLY